MRSYKKKVEQLLLLLTTSVLSASLNSGVAGQTDGFLRAHKNAKECESREDGIFADAEDCQYYFHCRNGILVYLFKCPEGLIFEARENRCIFGNICKSAGRNVSTINSATSQSRDQSIRNQTQLSKLNVRKDLTKLQQDNPDDSIDTGTNDDSTDFSTNDSGSSESEEANAYSVESSTPSSARAAQTTDLQASLDDNEFVFAQQKQTVETEPTSAASFPNSTFATITFAFSTDPTQAAFNRDSPTAHTSDVNGANDSLPDGDENTDDPLRAKTKEAADSGTSVSRGKLQTTAAASAADDSSEVTDENGNDGSLEGGALPVSRNASSANSTGIFANNSGATTSKSPTASHSNITRSTNGSSASVRNTTAKAAANATITINKAASSKLVTTASPLFASSFDSTTFGTAETYLVRVVFNRRPSSSAENIDEFTNSKGSVTEARKSSTSTFKPKPSRTDLNTSDKTAANTARSTKFAGKAKNASFTTPSALNASTISRITPANSEEENEEDVEENAFVAPTKAAAAARNGSTRANLGLTKTVAASNSSKRLLTTALPLKAGTVRESTQGRNASNDRQLRTTKNNATSQGLASAKANKTDTTKAISGNSRTAQANKTSASPDIGAKPPREAKPSRNGNSKSTPAPLLQASKIITASQQASDADKPTRAQSSEAENTDVSESSAEVEGGVVITSLIGTVTDAVDGKKISINRSPLKRPALSNKFSLGKAAPPQQAASSTNATVCRAPVGCDCTPRKRIDAESLLADKGRQTTNQQKTDDQAEEAESANVGGSLAADRLVLDEANFSQTLCSKHECFNGGSYFSTSDSKSCGCVCTIEYKGVNCEEVRDETACLCQNGGKCVKISNGFQACQCPLGFLGGQCQHNLNDVLTTFAPNRQIPPQVDVQLINTDLSKFMLCKTNVCLNGGICLQTLSSNRQLCFCPRNKSGQFCERRV